MIRIAVPEDYDVVLPMADELVKDSVYVDMFKNYSMTRGKFEFYCNADKKNKSICILSLDNDTKELIGFAAFDVIPWLNTDAHIETARLAYIYVKPSHRGTGYTRELKEIFFHWGKVINATHYSIGLTRVTPKMEDSLIAEGFEKIETLYMKEIL